MSKRYAEKYAGLNSEDRVVRFYGEGPFRIVQKPAGPTVAIGLFHGQAEVDQALAEAGEYLGTSLDWWQNHMRENVAGFSLLIDGEVTA